METPFRPHTSKAWQYFARILDSTTCFVGKGHCLELLLPLVTFGQGQELVLHLHECLLDLSDCAGVPQRNLRSIFIQLMFLQDSSSFFMMN